VVDIPSRIRVLIAEDDASVREILAILVSAEHQPDVAVVDVRMPGGGANAARGIKQRCPHTVVLAFSGHDDAQTMRTMAEAGADGYLVKGSPVATIVATILRAGSGIGREHRRAA
jgi:DNA-binding NarL/FixJ family response regulator